MNWNVDDIFARARSAQTPWSRLSVPGRCRVIRPLCREIARECDSIARLIAVDAHKPHLDALGGDVLVTLEHMRYYQREAKYILRAKRVSKPSLFYFGTSFYQNYEPHGTVLIIGPSNYPLQLTLVPAITALIAGNAVVLKCSERCPATANLIAQLCERFLPRNLVQVFHGDGEQSHALIDGGPDLIFFTGSSRAGQQVARRAAGLLIPAVLELGGKDASLVFADCNLDRAVEGLVYGAFSNAGRVCVATKRLYVQREIFAVLLARLTERIKDLRVSEGPNPDLCPLPAAHLSEFRSQVEDALQRGATLYFPSDRSAVDSLPVLLGDVPIDARILAEESFGPVLCIAPFSNEAEAIELANRSSFALSSSVWTSDHKRARRIVAQLTSGSCAVNDVIRNIANPHVAFGGNRASGYGRYHGPEGLSTFSRTKTVMYARDRRKRERNWFPFQERTSRRLSLLIRLRHTGVRAAAKMFRLLPVLFGLLIAQNSSASYASSTDLSVEVQLTQENRGRLAYLIFKAPSGFPDEAGKAVRHGFLPIPSNSSVMHFNTELPPGTYAVAVYEDRNSNGKLDHNLLGIPKEPVGASNNPRPHFGPPRFAECSFQLGTSPQVISIRMVNGL